MRLLVGGRTFAKDSVKDDFPVFAREMVGVISADERDSVEKCHRHLVEKYDSVERGLRAKHSAVSPDSPDSPDWQTILQRSFVSLRFFNQ